MGTQNLFLCGIAAKTPFWTQIWRQEIGNFKNYERKSNKKIVDKPGGNKKLAVGDTPQSCWRAPVNLFERDWDWATVNILSSEVTGAVWKSTRGGVQLTHPDRSIHTQTAYLPLSGLYLLGIVLTIELSHWNTHTSTCFCHLSISYKALPQSSWESLQISYEALWHPFLSCVWLRNDVRVP